MRDEDGAERPLGAAEARRRIAAGDDSNAVLALDPAAERRPRARTGRLAGAAVLVKDNVDVAGLATTAGSLALADNVAARDAPVVAHLRAAGAVVLGKTNLSEWANFRSTASTSGWSAVGGLTTNPLDPSLTALGSSSGSAAAVAAGLVDLAVGTETDGSITSPAAVCGVVGLKPTTGLLPGAGIVPISTRQDTAGPIARSVAFAARLLSALAGPGAVDHEALLDTGALAGARIGVMGFHTHGYGAAVDAVFAAACALLRGAGATLVPVDDGPDLERIGELEWTSLQREFKDDLAAHLADRPDAVPVRTLADVIAFNRAHAEVELAHFGQEVFEAAEATDGRASDGYDADLALLRRLAGHEGLDRLLDEGRHDALVAPTTGRAFAIRLDEGDRLAGACTTLPAVTGAPHLTVPMGLADGLPVGLSFVGRRGDDARVLALGASFEHHRDG